MGTIAPEISVTNVRTMKEALYGANGFFIFLLGAILASATVVGVYGLVAYLATQRTAEIGIRLALGASRVEIFKLVIRGGMRLLLFGLPLGAIAAFGLSKLINHLSFALAGNDPVIYVEGSVLLSAVALLACCVPAWKATRIDPVVALRHN